MFQAFGDRLTSGHQGWTVPADCAPTGSLALAEGGQPAHGSLELVMMMQAPGHDGRYQACAAKREYWSPWR
jgi:hypothetical protein